MPNSFTRLISMLPGYKTHQLSYTHYRIVKNRNSQKNNALERVALILLVVFFGCLGVASAGVPEMWTPSKVFFVAGFLLFMIGNREKGKNSTSRKGG